MKISSIGTKLIQHFEKCRLRAYPDPGTGGAPWTCGWGSTGPDIGPHTVFTQAQADARFMKGVSSVEAQIGENVTAPLSQCQYDALCSIVYNVGYELFDLGNGRPSGLVRRLNERDYHGAAAEFLRWTYSNHKKLDGLVERRTAEHCVFQGLNLEHALDIAEGAIA